MTNTQHTPGPWMHRTPRGDNTVMAEDGCPIAVVYTGPEDARLIAAAPELLAALQDCVAVPNKNRPDEVWQRARAAIANATGQ